MARDIDWLSLAGMLSASIADPDDAAREARIRHALALASEAVGADHAALTQLETAEPSLTRTYRWGRADQGHGPEVTELPLPWSRRRLLGDGEAVILGSLDDLPPEAALDRRALAGGGVGALASFPLISGGEPLGILTFSTRATPCPWPAVIVDNLRLIAHMVGGALARSRAGNTLRHSLAFERFISELSTSFVALALDDIDARITTALGQVAEFLDLDRSALAQRAAEDEPLQVTHQWVRKEFSHLRLPPHLPQEALPWVNTQWVRARTPVFFTHLDELPAEAAQDRAFMERSGLKSAAGFPLIVAGAVIGTVSFVSLRHHRRWPHEVIDRLRLVVEMLASSLARQRDHAALRQHLAFERLVADLSTTFVNLAPGEVDSRITEAMGRVGRFLDLDRSHLSQTSIDGGGLSITHQWIREELISRRIPAHDPRERVPWIVERLLRGETYTYARREELPPQAARDLEFFTRHGTKSYVIIPMFIGGQVIGGLSFGTIRHERSWPPEVLDRLRLVAELFASSLARKRGDLALRAALADNERLRQRLEAENVYLQAEVQSSHDFQDIVGQSPALRAVLHKVDQVAGTDAPVLLLGETGTGKELIARAIHDRSTRRGRPLITVNCAALPASLIEGELFGHERGAFTGATAARPGRFELADASTLFLDEIGDLDPALQAKLLRALQGGEIQRLGSTHPLKVDVRVIAATNRDLDSALREGRFRDDLYYRLNVFPIELPPLRQRREDVPLLIWHLIEARQRVLRRRITEIPQRAMDALMAYDWPGNVRELQNVIERALILSTGPVLRLEEAFGTMRRAPGSSVRAEHLAENVRDIERAHLLSVLERCAWNIEGRGQAAERLGLHPSTLRHRMKKLGIRRPERA